jgi:hypothetical protein
MRKIRPLPPSTIFQNVEMTNALEFITNQIMGENQGAFLLRPTNILLSDFPFPAHCVGEDSLVSQSVF